MTFLVGFGCPQVGDHIGWSKRVGGPPISFKKTLSFKSA